MHASGPWQTMLIYCRWPVTCLACQVPPCCSISSVEWVLSQLPSCCASMQAQVAVHWCFQACSMPACEHHSLQLFALKFKAWWPARPRGNNLTSLLDDAAQILRSHHLLDVSLASPMSSADPGMRHRHHGSMFGSCRSYAVRTRHAGAELANVLNEGALEAVRRGADIITRTDIYNGIDRVLQVRAPPWVRVKCRLMIPPCSGHDLPNFACG